MQQNPFDQFDSPAPRPGIPGAPMLGQRGAGRLYRDPYKDSEEERKRRENERQDRELGIKEVVTQIAIDNARRQAEDDAGKPQRTGFDQSAKLRDDFVAAPGVKAYRTAIPLYASALRSPEDGSGDLQLVNAFAKVMDPTSAVLGGEADAVANSGGWIESATAALNRELNTNGGKFLPERRKALKEAMAARVRELNAAYIQERKNAAGIAQRYGLNPQDIIGEHAGIPYQDAEAAFLNRPVNQMDAQGNIVQPAPQYRGVLQGGSPFKPDPNAGGLNVDITDDRLPGESEAAYQARARQGQNVTEAPTFMRGVGQGLDHVWNRLAVGAETGINKALGTNLDAASRQAAEHDAYFRQNPGSDGGQLLGNMVGAALPTSRLGAFMGGAAGSVLGGDSNTLGGIARDAIVGGIGGKVADYGLRGAAGLISPRLPASVPRLGQEGVQLSIPTMIGGRLKNLEDRATSLPIVGPKITAAREAANSQVNVAAYRRALRAAGIQAPKDLAAGHDGVAFVEKALGDQYNNTLAQMQVGLDRTFQTRMQAIMRGTRLRPQEQQQFSDIFQHEIGGAFAKGQPLTGRDYKALDERLGDIATSYSRSDDPFTRRLGGAIGKTREQLASAARRQNPAFADTLRKTDAGWAIYTRIRTAAAKSGDDGIANPNELMAAVRQGDRSIGRGATARGDALLQDLAGDAQATLPRRIGDSGTSDRENITDWKAWLAGAALNPLYSPTLQRGAQGLLLAPRHPAANSVADSLRRLPGGALGGVYGGMLFAPQN